MLFMKAGLDMHATTRMPSQTHQTGYNK